MTKIGGTAIAEKLGTIGGTDISAIMGMNPWKSAFGVYQKIIGEGVETKDNAAMKRGRDWEPALITLYETQRGNGPDDRTGNGKLSHKVYGYLTGSPDMMYWTAPDGDFGLEVKTADISQRNLYDFTGDEPQVPLHYFLQLQWYAGLAQVDRWDFIVGFFVGEKMVSWETCSFAFDAELFESMIESAVTFWENHVVPRIAPEATEPTEIIEWHRQKYRRHVPKSFAERTESTDAAVKRFLELQAEIKRLEKEQDAAKATVIATLQDNEAIETPFGTVTFKNNKDSEVIDWRSIANESLSMLEPKQAIAITGKYTTTKPGPRVLRFPKIKGEE